MSSYLFLSKNLLISGFLSLFYFFSIIPFHLFFIFYHFAQNIILIDTFDFTLSTLYLFFIYSCYQFLNILIIYFDDRFNSLPIGLLLISYFLSIYIIFISLNCMYACYSKRIFFFSFILLIPRHPASRKLSSCFQVFIFLFYLQIFNYILSINALYCPFALSLFPNSEFSAL